MTCLRVLGVDPGPVPGIVVLDFEDVHASAAPTFFPKWRLVRAEALQCSHTLAPDLLEHLIDKGRMRGGRLIVQTEKFVVGPRSARSSTAGAGQTTRDLIGELKRVTSGQCHMVQRNAGSVKPWATDARLEAAGLLTLAKPVGRHSVDAARHALFCAVHDGGIPDPLSKNWSAA